MRATRNEMLMNMAFVVAKRGTCDRLQVGAVIARDGRVISSGYNGNIVDMIHCHHDPEGPACTDAVHAEANAILFAARHGMGTEGAHLFTTHQPCLNCAKMIINAGISKVFYSYPYRDSSGLELLLAHHRVEIYQYHAPYEVVSQEQVIE